MDLKTHCVSISVPQYQLLKRVSYEIFDLIFEYYGETIINMMKFRCISRYCRDYIDDYSLAWSRFKVIELNCPKLWKNCIYFNQTSDPVKIQWMNRVCDYGERLSMPIDYKYSNAENSARHTGYLKVIMYSSGDADLDQNNLKGKSRLIKDAYLHNLRYFNYRWNSILCLEKVIFNSIFFSSRIIFLFLFLLRSLHFFLSRTK